MSLLERARNFLLPKFRQILQFLLKQGIAMAGNLLYGLLCVRILPIPEYAKFAVLFGYMGSLTVLLDTGISSTLPPLVGEQITNLQLIADYVASIRRILSWVYLAVSPVAVIIFIFLVQKQHWSTLVVVQMIVVLLVTAWFARVSSTYGAVLTLRRDRNRYYRAQIIGSVGSLILLAAFWAFHCLNIYVAILLNVAQVIFIAITYYTRARELMGCKGVPTRRQEKAIVNLALPNVPSMVFYAIQGQITLMLITLFGHSASSVASIGALSRLGQILVFLAPMNAILVEPFFAKLQASRLKRTYLAGVALVTGFAAGFAALAFLFPQVFLWILGPNYNQLRVEVGLVVLGSTIRFVGGFMWTIHTSRRFVYWWNNVANIICTVLVQAAFLWKFDLSSIRGVLIFNIVSAIVGLLITISSGVYGFWHGPQKMDRSAA